MNIQKRMIFDEMGKPVLLGLVLVSESKEESEAIDLMFSSKVKDGDGLIASGSCPYEVRLSDGYAEHYIYLKKEK